MQESRTVETACIACSGTDRGAVHAVVNAVVLRMVEKVEVLPAKIERARFAEGESLEEAEIEVNSAGIGQCIAAYVAKGQPNRNLVGCRVIKQRASHAGNFRR